MPNSSLLEYRDQMIVDVLFTTGMRVSELVQLKLSDINCDQREAIILGKGEKYRYCFFPKETADRVRHYIQFIRPALSPIDSSTLVLNSKGQPLTSRSVQRLLKKVGSHNNLSHPLTPHTLRHSFATELYKNGADLKVVQELLGHDHITTTQVYTHVSLEQLRNTYFSAHPRALTSQ